LTDDAESSFGPAATAIGSLQAAEAIKILSGVGEPLTGELTLFDALELKWRRAPLTCSTDCACSQS
jgi:adenylyltransferase/sulfurtransferase